MCIYIAYIDYLIFRFFEIPIYISFKIVSKNAQIEILGQANVHFHSKFFEISFFKSCVVHTSLGLLVLSTL